MNKDMFVQTLGTPFASWAFFTMIILAGILLYWLLIFVKGRISRLSLSFKAERKWSNFLRQILLLYELFYGVVIGSLFILINPFWHGLILFFLLLITFPMR